MEQKESSDVIVNVVTTINDITNLCHPDSVEVHEKRADDIHLIRKQTESLGKNLMLMDNIEGSLLCVVIDRSNGPLINCQHLCGMWKNSDLKDIIHGCFSNIIHSDNDSKQLGLSVLSQGIESLEDWEIGNCLPNYDTRLSWISSSERCRLTRELGKIQMMRRHSMKAMFLNDWRIASIQDCFTSMNAHDTQDHLEQSKPSRTFKKRRSEHGPVGGDFGKIFDFYFLFVVFHFQ